MSDYAFKGVYSLKKSGSKALKKQYYCAWHTLGGYIVQQLDLKQMQPVGEPAEVNADLFPLQFSHEQSIKYSPGQNEMNKLAGKRIAAFVPPGETPPDKLDHSEQHDAKQPEAKQDEQHDAKQPELQDMDFDSLLQPQLPDNIGESHQPGQKLEDKVEEQLRSRFSTAITDMKDPRKRNASISSLQDIIEHEDGVQPTHKHVFNEFGITLRKSKLFNLSLQCYVKVIRLSPSDSHAYFNAARLMYDNGKVAEAEKYLNEALTLQPDFDYAITFLDYIQLGSKNKKNARP